MTRFQTTAPTSPANAIDSVTIPGSMIPVAIVAATFSEMNAPAKFSTAATITAVRGDSALVEIDEATTLAVSWNPLVKSNTSAPATTSTSRNSLRIPLPPSLPAGASWAPWQPGRTLSP